MDERRAQLEAQLSAYLDDELTPKQRTEVEAFLAKDTQARAMLAELRAISSALRGLPRARASSDLMENLRGRMERKALLGEQEVIPPKAGGGMSSTGRWVAAATIVLMTGVAGYVTWIINGSDTHIASPQQQLALTDRPRTEERIVVGRPLELAMGKLRENKSLIQQEPAPPAERLAGIRTDLASVTPAVDRTQQLKLANNVQPRSVMPAITASRPSPATILLVACADDDSRQRLLSEFSAVPARKHAAPIGRERTAAAPGDNIHLGSIVQTAPAGSSVTDCYVVVADERARDDLVGRLSRGSSPKQAATVARRSSLATNAPAKPTLFGRPCAAQTPTAPQEQQAATPAMYFAKQVRPNAAAESLALDMGGVGGQPITSPTPSISTPTTDAKVAFALDEAYPAASTAPSQYFVKLNIRIAKPASSRPAIGVTASSPAESSQAASYPATQPTSQP